VKKIIYCDTHYMGAYPVGDPYSRRPSEFGKNVMYLGDIWDFSGARKTKKKKMSNDYNIFLQQCSDTGTVTVRGNHCCVYGLEQPYQHKEGKVLYIHGHRAIYSRKSVDHWENKKGGKGFFRYWAIVAKNTFAAAIGHGVNKETLQKFAKFAEARGCDTIVVGHKHPKKLVDIMVGFTRVIVCPRGRTEIDV